MKIRQFLRSLLVSAIMVGTRLTFAILFPAYSRFIVGPILIGIAAFIIALISFGWQEKGEYYGKNAVDRTTSYLMHAVNDDYCFRNGYISPKNYKPSSNWFKVSLETWIIRDIISDSSEIFFILAMFSIFVSLWSSAITWSWSFTCMELPIIGFIISFAESIRNYHVGLLKGMRNQVDQSFNKDICHSFFGPIYSRYGKPDRQGNISKKNKKKFVKDLEIYADGRLVLYLRRVRNHIR